MTDFLESGLSATNKKHIHFIGIGGSGMYPLAQILHNQGYLITGSDNNETVTLDAVRKMGIEVFLGHSPENIGDADLIIYSSAISVKNPELYAAVEKGVEAHDRAELLGLLTSRHERAVCVVGTHGKTTMTSMLIHILLAARLDISAFVGGKLEILDGSSRMGDSGIMVVEACEFNNNFLKLEPNITVILNIDEDHMDYFKTMDNLRGSFSKFCDLTTDLLIINGDDENTVLAVNKSDFSVKRDSKDKIITFGFSGKNDYYPQNIRQISDFESSFELWRHGERLAEIVIGAPGEHNVLNAVAACATAIYLMGQNPLSLETGINDLKEGLRGFKGAGRRFERIYEQTVCSGNNGADCSPLTVVDDYAHHPAEIEATLKTAKSMNFKRIWAVHQPFTYSRTAALLDEFAKALSIADKVVLSAIMGGREVDEGIVKSEDLAEKINEKFAPGNAIVFQDFYGIAEYIAQNAESGDLIITMGCGDVDKAARMIAERLNK